MEPTRSRCEDLIATAVLEMTDLTGQNVFDAIEALGQHYPDPETRTKVIEGVQSLANLWRCDSVEVAIRMALAVHPLTRAKSAI